MGGVVGADDDTAGLQAFFLVSDDIMDASVTRRGQPCWYKARDPPYKGWKGHAVDMVAINDAFLIEYVPSVRLLHSTPSFVHTHLPSPASGWVAAIVSF